MSSCSNASHYFLKIFLTDGGLETSMIFHEGIDLPEFGVFVLLETTEGRTKLSNYYQNMLDPPVLYTFCFSSQSLSEWARKMLYFMLFN